MFGNPSLNTRIAVGKTLGALFGLAGLSTSLSIRSAMTACCAGEYCSGTRRWARSSACSASTRGTPC